MATTTIPHPVKLLVEICGRCHGELVGDNTGSGRPWQHLAGEPADGHLPHFGVVLEREAILAACIRRDTTEADQEAADAATMPAPEIPAHAATETEIGESGRLGRRQIINLARRNEFTIDVRFARGPAVADRGKSYRQADSLGVFGIHADGRRFHAWWLEDAGGDLVFQNARCGGVIGFQSSEALKTYLRG
jgi:hypothetical protein